ncbi:hypothetical protein TrLO_g11268 [Triparma laevis f. longispina]|uniref:Prenyltransferase alpha-alpha toroid domain-containing protein n=1 Tax=Triparma laevis f. longispina TaxID=1714387 RepID=A0A9W7AK03_9STRA|nr:hypothetical protein TrLO_g11268 [Triparma laevis f. longispina]
MRARRSEEFLDSTTQAKRDEVFDKLCENVAEFIVSCKTYEGGFDREPGNKAHGGYAFFAVAALKILGKLDMCDVEALKGWIAWRQMSFEGGFQGRVNKLVYGKTPMSSLFRCCSTKLASVAISSRPPPPSPLIALHLLVASPPPSRAPPILNTLTIRMKLYIQLLTPNQNHINELR